MDRQAKNTKIDLLKQMSMDDTRIPEQGGGTPLSIRKARNKLSTEVFNRARHTFTSIGDVLKSHPHNTTIDSNKKIPAEKIKPKRQTTLDYFLKPRLRSGGKHNDINSVVGNLVISPHKLLSNETEQIENTKLPHQNCLKQNSVNSKIPVKSRSNDFQEGISRQRPATISSGERPSNVVETPEMEHPDRPRKKLSFREPEIVGYAFQKSESMSSLGNASKKLPLMRSISEVFARGDSFDEEELENQAMRIVRTVGQAFEVCQKQSADDVAASPEPQDAGTISSLQDDLVDLNDVTSTGDMGSASAALDERLGVNDDFIHDTLDIHSEMATKADLIKEQMRLTTKTTDILRPSGSDTNVTNMTSRDTHSLQTTGETSKQSSGSLPHLGSSLSTHHEVQLLKEQLEQQSQQTQAAIAQIQLLQDQLSAERAARLEAQARTHQLLVHNRELLDHITALVAHLQDCERTQTVAQPQTKPNEVPPHLTCLPQQMCDPPYMGDYGYLTSSPDSPLRKNPAAGNIFNFNPVEQNLQSQILQQLSQLNMYNSSPTNTFNQFPYPQHQIAQAYQNMYNQQLNNNNIVPPLSNIPQSANKKMNSSPMSLRQSYSNPYDYSTLNSNFPENTDLFSNMSQDYSKTTNRYMNENVEKNKNIIKPLSQVGTLTTTDEDGRVRLIVPVPSGDNDKIAESLVTLRITDEQGNRRVINGPPCITRSTSEKVPNRSELMSQVQRTTWARHTTK